ncbi:PfkB family carbohydrate kinase [Bacillus suaedae]|uniref:Winged helix-turn-helix transcriptional regulator n=1 Tax=Halalkalibacter suaedae TaxID=2822140 RepID=A0A940WXM8_9BACI|nr:PfkB family carbohydrate kinase [Bacillus suaedae]MBP3950190.1 winged helix-turn-helix transcriptional regulator [Bacillus suaedae]
MNINEKEIIRMIRENPYISQNEMAEALQLSRSAVAVYISNMMKKGIILGKAYIIKDNYRIVCVGGATVDRKAIPKDKIVFGTSNPVFYHRFPGGVARNVAENLGRLGCNTTLITCVGDDEQGNWLLNYTREANVDVSQSLRLNNYNTGSYTIISDSDGKLLLGLDDLHLYESLSLDMFEKRWNHMSSADLLFLDFNYPVHITAEVIQRAQSEGIRVCTTIASSTRTDLVPSRLDGIYLLCTNNFEAAELLGYPVETEQDIRTACHDLQQQKGVLNILMNMREKGIYLYTEDQQFHWIKQPTEEVLDWTGNRDAFMAGVILGLKEQYDLVTACEYGAVMSMITISDYSTVNTNITLSQLEEGYKKYFGS